MEQSTRWQWEHIVIIRSKLFPRWSCCGTWARDQRVPGQVNTTPHFLVQIWGELELTLNYTSTWILDTAQIQLEYFHIMLYEQISSHLFSPMRWQFNASFSWPLPWHVKSWNARTVSRCVSEKTNHKRNEWRWMVWKQDLGTHSSHSSLAGCPNRSELRENDNSPTVQFRTCSLP